MSKIQRLILKKGRDLAMVKSPMDDKIRFIGSVFVVLSGCILYLDKAFPYLNIEVIMPAKFNEAELDTDFFIWLCCITISPFLIIIGAILRSYVYAYLAPIFCYTLQAYFILIDYTLVDDGYNYTYSLGISIILLGIMIWVKNASQRQARKMIEAAKVKISEKRKGHATE